MRITTLKIADITPDKNNPRHNSNSIEKVAESIKEFGFKVPVVVDRNNVIVAGHTRIAAARLLGLEEVPAIRADDLTDEQIKAYRIADNATGELAGWDFRKLETELEGISQDMAKFGFHEANDMEFEESLFMDDEKPEPQEIQCPYCGEWFVP